MKQIKYLERDLKEILHEDLLKCSIKKIKINHCCKDVLFISIDIIQTYNTDKVLEIIKQYFESIQCEEDILLDLYLEYM